MAHDAKAQRMYEQYLVRERRQERLRQADDERTGQRIAKIRKLERQQERAERQLLQAGQRVEQLRSIISTG